MRNRLRFQYFLNHLFSSILVVILFAIFGNPVGAEGIQLKEGDDIQRAISEAKEGSTIFLTMGTYVGPIHITKPLSLIGEKGAKIDGAGSESVIQVSANDVTISGLIIENSGQAMIDSGVFVDRTDHNHIDNNTFVNVQNGIYINNGKENVVSENTISSYGTDLSKRGNGIHLYKGMENVVKNNRIVDVQDGIYFDFAKDVLVTDNEIQNSRYAMHFMFSEEIRSEGNVVQSNITGMMIMDSSRLEFYQNQVLDQFHFRGFGILIYDSHDLVFIENEIVRNSVGISFENAMNTKMNKNIVAANQVGLEFRADNQNNLFTENNFISNIVSSTIGKEELRLDNGIKGNYWDDYRSYDTTGDGIGELPYKAGSLYDNLLKQQPLWQFFFESPAIGLWSKAESMFPSLGTVEVYDRKPLVEPVEIMLKGKNQEERDGNPYIILLAVSFIGLSLLIILKGRKYI